jgi:hypothetical protein
MCEADQSKFDKQCPTDFQSAQYVLDHGQIDMVLDTCVSPADTQAKVESLVFQIASNLLSGGHQILDYGLDCLPEEASDADKQAAFNYTRSRAMDRPQTQDIISNLFDDFVELSGDGRVGRDVCIRYVHTSILSLAFYFPYEHFLHRFILSRQLNTIINHFHCILRGGLASFSGQVCVVLGTFKGHGPQAMLDANYGMASPHGYRTAMRLMQMAERFGLPVVTLVDTVGAWPTFECERDGQSEAIATNLTVMAGLTVPIVTLLVGEGGSGGALGLYLYYLHVYSLVCLWLVCCVGLDFVTPSL